jgi:hypothetical protein
MEIHCSDHFGSFAPCRSAARGFHRHGKPEIVNVDQGGQFAACIRIRRQGSGASSAWTGAEAGGTMCSSSACGIGEIRAGILTCANQLLKPEYKASPLPPIGSSTGFESKFDSIYIINISKVTATMSLSSTWIYPNQIFTRSRLCAKLGCWVLGFGSESVGDSSF